MTEMDIFTVMRTVIMTVTGVSECILADQRGDISPSVPYASVRPIQSLRERGQANIYKTNAANNQVQYDIRAQIIADCNVNFYRGDAMTYAQMLKQCNKRPDISMYLMKQKIGWLGSDAPNNLTALQAGSWERRAQITCRLMYETSDVSLINNILSVGLALQNEKGNQIASADIALHTT